jgi:phage terminase large subunit-like protein
VAVVVSEQSCGVVKSYAEAVIRGEIVAGKLIRLACERHLRDLATGRERGLYFDEDAAQHAIEFFGWLKHSKGEWAKQSFQLEPWQQFIVGVLFGWKRADGLRRFRNAYIEIPRKNGKSTLASGIGLYLLVADGEPGAEVYTAATKRDQARITHGEATRMVKASPALRKRVRTFKDNLNVPATNSKYEPLGADADTMDGLNLHGGIIDELHAHKTREVVDVLDTATGARRQPLIFVITTAGWDRNSVCWQHHQYSSQVLEEVLEDDTWFAFVATIDKEDDWTDPSVWQKANPNWGISVKPDDLARKANRAKNIPSEQNAFKRLHLNIWTEQSERWLDIEKWNECEGEVIWERLREQLRGRRCYGGLDLANTTDIAALVLVFPDDEDPCNYTLLAFFWVPEETVIERTRKASVPYLTWVEQGLIEATPGNVIDYKAIKVRLDEIAQEFDLQELAYDRWNSSELIRWLEDGGINVIPLGQGFASMSAPTKETKTLTLSKRLRHGGNPVLKWMASNMVVRLDPAGNEKPDKSKSTEKIDGMVAAIMALARATLQAGESVYEDRGLIVL